MFEKMIKELIASKTITVIYDENCEPDDSDLVKEMGKQNVEVKHDEQHGYVDGPKCSVILDFSKCPKELNKNKIEGLLSDEYFKFFEKDKRNSRYEYRGKVKAKNIKIDEKQHKINADLYWVDEEF